jgi:hypothetical protein
MHKMSLQAFYASLALWLLFLKPPIQPLDGPYIFTRLPRRR